MAPADRRGGEARRFFAEKAEEARRSGLYKHGSCAKAGKRLSREAKETLVRYHADGATLQELADIFGFKTRSGVSVLIKRETAAKPNALAHPKRQQMKRDPSTQRKSGEKRDPRHTCKIEAAQTHSDSQKEATATGPSSRDVKDIAATHPDKTSAKSSKQKGKESPRSLSQSTDHAKDVARSEPPTHHSAGATSCLGKRHRASIVGNRGDNRGDADHVDRAKIRPSSNASGARHPGGTGSVVATKEASTKDILPTQVSAPQNAGVSFKPGPTKRSLYCVRLSEEDTLGFSVEHKEEERFRVSRVEEGGAAARAGITVGQYVLSYNLNPLGANGKSSRNSSRAFEKWASSSLETINQYPAMQAIEIKVVSLSGFSRQCIDRRNHIQFVKQSIYSCRPRALRVKKLNSSVIQYDTTLVASSSARKRLGNHVLESQLETRESAESRTPSATNEKNRSTQHTSNARATGIVSNSATETAAESAVSPVALAKRVTTDASYHPSRAGCWVEFFQAGKALSEPYRVFLTPEALQTIKTKELTTDLVMFFFMKLAQFLPYHRLRVLSPKFYHSVVLNSKFAEWQPFAESSPSIICLPVFERGRWVLIAIASTATRIIVHYLDCQNPNNFLLPICSRIVQFIDTAYDVSQKNDATATVAKPLVVSKLIQTTPAARSGDSGVFVVSYFAAIVRAVAEYEGECDALDRAIVNASFDRIFSREKLEAEARLSWMDCMQSKVYWGRHSPGNCRPCLRLNLRPSSVQTQDLGDEEMDVAVIYLLGEPPGVQWISETGLLPFGVIQQGELVEKLGLTREEARRLAPLYDCEFS